MTFFDLFLAGLAAHQVVYTFHHGSIFDNDRAYYEAKGGFKSQLFLCPFCFNHWTSLGFVVANMLDEPLSFEFVVLLVTNWLVVTALATIVYKLRERFVDAAIAEMENLHKRVDRHSDSLDALSNIALVLAAELRGPKYKEVQLTFWEE